MTAAIEIVEVDYERGADVAMVVLGLLDMKRREVEIWDDWKIDENGEKSRIWGGCPFLRMGKRYFVYLINYKIGQIDDSPIVLRVLGYHRGKC